MTLSADGDPAEVTKQQPTEPVQSILHQDQMNMDEDEAFATDQDMGANEDWSQFAIASLVTSCSQRQVRMLQCTMMRTSTSAVSAAFQTQNW